MVSLDGFFGFIVSGDPIFHYMYTVFNSAIIVNVVRVARCATIKTTNPTLAIWYLVCLN